MYNFQSSNPCLCSSPGTPPVVVPECKCLQVCNVTVNALNDVAVGPCASTQTLDIASPAFSHDTCVCGDDPVTWSIVDYDPDIFITAEITTAGVLTWITGGPETAGQYGVITVKVCCGILSTYACIIVGVKDLCKCPSCGTCQNCDPCTGQCLDNATQVEIGGVEIGADPELNSI